MFTALLQLVVLVCIGVVVQHLIFLPFGIGNVRRILTGLVYYLLLPALILQATWKSALPSDFGWIILIAAICVIVPFLGIYYYGRWQKLSSTMLGATLLAGSFPNTTYMGIPILGEIFGAWTRNLIIAYDQMSCMPLILTLGVTIASRLGNHEKIEPPHRALSKVPALWAGLTGLILFQIGLPIPNVINFTLNSLASAVSPIMLIALGMALELKKMDRQTFEIANLLALMQLIIVPLCAYLLSRWVGMTGEMLQAMTLEAAMPSMIFGLVLCDRFDLDAHFYARIVTYTTALSLISLPLIYILVS
ncbi:MAG TPA: transporter [Gammaproteobacteria bacterium]|nr:transporter [Gammaproteobacteria bacterium]